ncbi:MAG TPA: phosphatase PAP2 family protein [Bryobacteraceae bacterium]|jgi:membrane-associated phospholipid phosphatase|nr:phosphatase PAP2 family protein [Bryobacteraceae bacterium]
MRLQALTLALLFCGPLLNGQQADRVPEDVSIDSKQAWKQLAGNVLNDQKHVIAFPWQLVRHGNHWKATLVLSAATAGLIALDAHDAPYFRRTGRFDEFNEIASATNTAGLLIAVPVADYAWSAQTRNTYGKQTVFLAVEAMADAQIAAFGLQMVTRRLRPADVAPYGDFGNTWFRADPLARKSFPSGHAITAFALADVFSERYASHRWVPWVAYGLAGTIAFSRITTQGHFPSDVVAGAALGTILSHYLVLHHHAH